MLCESESHSVLSDSLQPHGLYSPWNFSGQNTGVGSLSLLQGIFATRLNPGLPHCRQILYQLSHKGSPRFLEWVAYPFSSESSWPRNWTGVSCIAGGFFANWAIREAHSQYTNIKRNEKQKEQRIHHQIGCLTNIQTYTALGSPMSQHIWSPHWEKVPSSTSALWLRLRLKE